MQRRGAMELGILLGVCGVVAVVAIYFLWVRKLGNKAPTAPATKAPDAHP
jgi:hypothetical protein